jgi:hypothetical protein
MTGQKLTNDEEDTVVWDRRERNFRFLIIQDGVGMGEELFGFQEAVKV